ncbi:IS30 family transposase, partial [Ancylomarina euxinus]
MERLTENQRYTISVMLKRGHSKIEIASYLGRDKSVIYRELKRNCDKRSGEYRADLAQRKYEKRLKDKVKRVKFTEELKSKVDELLKEDYSPEQVHGRLKAEGKFCVSHETIYQYVWIDKKQGGTLYLHLRCGNKRYRKRSGSKDKRGILRNRIGIEERPKIVDQKSRFGDLEIDTVIGKNHKKALLTINDRVTGLVWIRLLEGKHAKPLTAEAIQALWDNRGKIHTITADNGKEFADHQTIAEQLDVDVYFARPYHSWERGANE